MPVVNYLKERKTPKYLREREGKDVIVLGVKPLSMKRNEFGKLLHFHFLFWVAYTGHHFSTSRASSVMKRAAHGVGGLLLALACLAFAGSAAPTVVRCLLSPQS